MNLIIDEELQHIIPPLSDEEFKGLESDIVEHGIRIPIDIWGDIIVDGHNRYQIATKYNLPFVTNSLEFESKTHAKIWIIKNQLNRRNLNDAWRIELGLTLKNELAEIGRDKQLSTLKQYANDDTVLSLNDKTDKAHNTQKQIANELGISTGKLAQGEYVKKHAADIWDKAKNNELTVGGAYKKVKKQQNLSKKRIEQVSLESSKITVLLYHDDMFNRLRLLEDNSINLVIIDPPYNVKDDVEWDEIGTDEDYLWVLMEWLDAIEPKLAEHYHLFMFCDASYNAPIEMLLREENWPIKSRIIWEYRNLVKGRDVTDKFIQNWQMCFHVGNHPLNWSTDWDDKRFAVQNHATPQSNFVEGKYHIAQKPLALIKLFVEVGSKPNDLVLDCFAGSGTTGLACQEVKQRKCILIESNEGFVEQIEHRLGILRCVE